MRQTFIVTHAIWVVVLAFAGLLSIEALASEDLYRDYKKANPGWEPKPLTAGLEINEALALIYRPSSGRARLRATTMKIYDLVGEEWVEVKPEKLSIVADGVERIITVKRRCRSRSSGIEVTTSNYYHFVDNLLMGFAHAEFGRDCSIRNMIKPSYTRKSFEHLFPEGVPL